MKYEFEKLFRRKAVPIAAVLLLTVLYVILLFFGKYDTLSGIDIATFRKDKEYAAYLKIRKPEKVDAKWIADLPERYKAYVDKNRMTEEETRQFFKDQEAEGMTFDYTPDEALADPYNIDHAFGILKDEAYQSTEFEYWIQDFEVYLPLAEDPVSYMKAHYADMDRLWKKWDGITYMQSMGYSDRQTADFWRLVEKNYAGMSLTVGNSLGWDALTGDMQYLPYTLGIALIIVLADLFSVERASHMRDLARTTPGGRKKLFRAKMKTAFLATVCVWMVFQGAALIAAAAGFTLEGSSCTVLTYNGEPSLYPMTWGQYYLSNCLFSLLGSLCFALCVCLFSSLLPLRFSLPLQLALTILAGMPIGNFDYEDKVFKWTDWLRALTPAQFLASYPVFQVYQSFVFPTGVLRLPWMMGLAMAVETGIIFGILRGKEG